MNENSRFKPLITYFIWLICFLLIQSVWAWIFLKFRIGDGFDLQKRILFRMGILEVIMLIFCWMLNHFYTHEKLFFKKTFYLSFLGDFLIVFYMVVFKKNLYRIHAPLFCLITALLVACAEEFIMRGILLPSIMHHVHKTHVIWKGIFLSSFLLGVTHLMNILHQSAYQTMLQMIGTFLLGIILVVIYLKSGNLIMPILLHGLLDACSIGISTSHSTTMLNNHGNPLGTLILFVLALLFLATVVPKKQQAKIEKRFNV